MKLALSSGGAKRPRSQARVHSGHPIASSCAAALIALIAGRAGAAIELAPDGYHVHPGDRIQEALELAATNKLLKIVKVHDGTYQPAAQGQSMVWLNKAHRGIRLEAIGSVTLTASNAALVAPADPGYPAAVNHILYVGDGVDSNTVVSGFRLTGANGFLTKKGTEVIEPGRTPKNHFFYSDGGAIKIFGRSYPTLRNLEIVDNYTTPCGGGISIQHMGYRQGSVRIEDCVFRRNRAQGTGAAIDLLAGSQARIVNCLFVSNASNLGEDPVARQSGEKPFVNNGVVTIFWNSGALFQQCTFVDNRNAIDDLGGNSAYLNCIFLDNRLESGLPGHPRYDLDVNAGARVAGCFFNGALLDAKSSIAPTNNVLHAPPARWNQDHVPQAAEYRNAGYRPARAR